MSVSIARDAIALLIDLAQQGEINPWDVKVIEVIDRYLSDLAPAQVSRASEGRSPYEDNLSRSGQAFLYASMLVLLKADSLARSESVVEDEDGEGEVEELAIADGEQSASMPLRLEKQLRRRAVAPPPKKRRVTLPELISQLQLMEKTIAQPNRKRRSRRSRRKARKEAIRDVTQLAHEENLTETATKLEQFLSQHWHRIAPEQDWLPLDGLLQAWAGATQSAQTQAVDAQDPSRQHDRVGVFWALLLLSAQSKVELMQEEFYQDLKLRLIPARSDRVHSEAETSVSAVSE